MMLVGLVLMFVVLWCCVKTDVEVGVLMELDENKNAAARVLALHAALDCMRTGNTTFCPACADVHASSVRLKFILADAGRDKTTAENKALDMVRENENITGFIGPLYSTNCEAVATVLRPLKLCLVSPTATNAALDLKTNFFRTTPADTVVCDAIMAVIMYLNYASFVGLMEATSGGVSDGINRRIHSLAPQDGIGYQPVFFDGFDLNAAMGQLKTLNPQLILAVGDSSETTFALYQKLHDLRAAGELSYKVLLGSDMVAGGSAPLVGSSPGYFEGVVSFKSEGGGLRFTKFAQSWPELVKTLAESWPDLIKTPNAQTTLNVNGKAYPVPAEHKENPPSYAMETFEAAVLYAKAAILMLEQGIPTMRDAITLLFNQPPWYCLDNEPVRLNPRTRVREKVLVFRHENSNDFIPSVIGEWTPSGLTITNSQLDDLLNPAPGSPAPTSDPPATTAPTIEVPEESSNVLLYCVIGVLIALVIFTCVALAVCYRCPEYLPQRLRRVQDAELPGVSTGREHSTSIPHVAVSPRRDAQPTPPSQKDPDHRTIAILGGGVEALLLCIQQARMALLKPDDAPTQMRLFTNKFQRGAGGLQRIEQEPSWVVEVLSGHAQEMLDKISPAANWTAGEGVWGEKMRNVVDTKVEDELVLVLNRMVQDQDRTIQEEGGVVKFKVDVESYPNFQQQAQWQSWHQFFFNPDVADALVVTGETCCLGLLSRSESPAGGEAVQYALRIAVEPNPAYQQSQMHNLFMSICNTRGVYNYDKLNQKGTLILRITQEERNSIRLPAASASERLGSRYFTVDLIWPTTPDRTFELLHRDLGILSNSIKEFLSLFKMVPDFVKRIECVKFAPAAMMKQTFLKPNSNTPVVLLGRSAFVSDILGRGFSCGIKGAFMAAVALRLFLFSKNNTALDKLERNFLKLDRDDEMNFSNIMCKVKLPQFLDDIVRATGEDRFASQVHAMQREIAAADTAQRKAKRAKIVKDLAKRCQRWQKHTIWKNYDQDIESELTSSETDKDSPLFRDTVGLEVLYVVHQAFYTTGNDISSVSGLPKDILRGDAQRDVSPQHVFEISADPLNPAIAAAPGVAAG